MVGTSTLRRAIRVLVLISTITLVAMVLIGFVPMTPAVGQAVASVLTGIEGISEALIFFAGLVFVRELCKRIPNTKLTRLVTWTIWGGVALAVSVALTVTGLPTQLLSFTGALLCVVLLLLVALSYGILFLSLSSRLV